MKDHCNDPHENLAWLDLETTGLRPNEDAILELGVVITNKDLDIVAEISAVVEPSRNTSITEIDPEVAAMHTKSGLWHECLAGSDRLSFEAACLMLYRFIREHDAAGSPMCGSTISFDRGFLKVQAPELLSVFHYRNIDVSTLKNVMEMHFSSCEPYVPKKEPTHRVIDDLHDSIEEYQHYLDFIRCD